MVSPRYAEYLNYGTEQASQLAADYFIYPMGNNADWEWTSIASLGKDDNDDSWNSGNEGTTTYGDYKIWRYAVENTIPRFGTDNYSAQKKGLTTGVVFKGHIDVTEEASPLYRAFNAGEDIYMFNEVIYGGVTELAKAVEASPVSALADAFNAAFNKVISGEGESQSVTFEKKEGVEMGKLGFTVYKKDVASGKYTDDADPRNYSMEISVNNIKRKHFFPELGTLPRNTHVVVHITCDADTKVSCQVDVIPYSQVILEPDFGL